MWACSRGVGQHESKQLYVLESLEVKIEEFDLVATGTWEPVQILDSGQDSVLARRLGSFFGTHTPEKTRATNMGKSQSKELERPLPPSGPVAADPEGDFTIVIYAKLASKQKAITDLTPETTDVAVAAPPSGDSNAELCRYISKVLKLRKSDVVLDKGGKSCEKVVKILASTIPAEILEKLKKQAEDK
ncbi:UPF0235 protein C15orf40 homolog [Choloepus didactylus]|uniref:UPF0235 protein C15orf40 homolog n=1 Tax=Choloepus didactylus TaxID=27675 RepID=UPI00189C9CEE|nr:UPF0235 protein C15orf40 homolog [Choloepus didactylus]